MDQSQFEERWTAAEPKVRAFLAAGCRDAAMVDDWVQEVAATGWRKRSQFDQERPFEAWLVGMARFVLLRHRRDKARGKVILAPDLIERLEILATAEIPFDDGRPQALAACVQALGEPARTLLKIRYETNRPLAEVAQQLGRSHGAVRTALVRIRESLKRCVQDRLSGKHHSNETYAADV